MGLVLAGGVFAGYVMLCDSVLVVPELNTDSCLPDLELISLRLTLGLMGLDELHLRVLATSSDDPKEKQNAKKGMVQGIIRA